MFPAYVGMSPAYGWELSKISGVPRIRGDEPFGALETSMRVVCSPHTWG